MTVEVSILIAVIGCLIGIAGWLTNRDKTLATDAEWKGQVNAKLDIIVGMQSDITKLTKDLSEQRERISRLETRLEQIHFMKGVDSDEI